MQLTLLKIFWGLFLAHENKAHVQPSTLGLEGSAPTWCWPPFLASGPSFPLSDRERDSSPVSACCLSAHQKEHLKPGQWAGNGLELGWG